MYPAHALPEQLPAFVMEMDARGFDEIWLVEDCFASGALTLAAMALGLSDKLRVGVGLLPATVRNPAVAAMEIATLARAFPGRLTVAFGHGVETWMAQIGARPPRRLAALGEVVTAVRMLLAGETVNVAGSFVTLEAVALDNPPEVAPEIFIGTTGPQGIALAARRADGLLLPEGCGPRFVGHARELTQRAALGPSSPSIVVYSWLAAGARAHTRRQLADVISRWLESGLYRAPIDAVRATASVDAVEVNDAIAEELAITGPTGSCVEVTRRFLAAGADRLVLAAIAPDFAEQYTLFAEEILPLIRASRQ